MDKNKFIQNLENLSKEDSFKKVLKESFSARTRLKDVNRKFLLFILITILLNVFLQVNSSTYIAELIRIINHLNNVALYFITIVFTGYAIFQALLGENTLVTLLINKNTQNDNSTFKEYNLTFLWLCLYILFMLFINFNISFLLNSSFAITMLISLPSVLKFSIKIIFGITYLSLNIYMFIEMIFFFYNIYQNFTMDAIQRGIDILKK